RRAEVLRRPRGGPRVRDRRRGARGPARSRAGASPLGRSRQRRSGAGHGGGRGGAAPARPGGHRRAGPARRRPRSRDRGAAVQDPRAASDGARVGRVLTAAGARGRRPGRRAGQGRLGRARPCDRADDHRRRGGAGARRPLSAPGEPDPGHAKEPRNRMVAGLVCGRSQSEAAFLAMADLRLAAWFLWMTPFDAALSSLRAVSAASALASSTLPASAASWNRRTAVFSAERTDLLRARAASFWRLRLICDLMFATANLFFRRSGDEKSWCVRTLSITGSNTQSPILPASPRAAQIRIGG